MTEIQAAIGRRQLLKLPNWLAQRRANAHRLAKGLSNLRGLSIPLPGGNMEHAWYKFYAMIELDRLKSGWDHSKVIDAINAEGIPCMAGSCWQIYREKAFVNAGYVPVAAMPVAESSSQRSLMFMVHPTLGQQEMDDTVAAVGKVMRAALL